MSMLGSAGRMAGKVGRKVATRSKWLARRLWVVMVADVALTGHRHWRRLDERERSRLIELARKSYGRPSKNLTAKERREATELLDKLGHIELAGSIAGTVLPFAPLSKLATRVVVGKRDAKRAEAAAEAKASA